MSVTNRIPPKLGNHAVIAVAAPSIRSETSASTCSRTKMMTAMTPTARNPGISRTVWSQPISTPVKSAASITQLLISADHVAKDRGIAAAIRNRRNTGCRQNG
jgi:hypothetical protein